MLSNYKYVSMARPGGQPEEAILLNCEIQKQINITAFYSIFYEKLMPDYNYPGEIHDFWEIVLVLSGNIGVTAGSNVFILEEGQCILHRPMEFHSLWSAKGTSPEIVLFTFEADILTLPEKFIFSTTKNIQQTLLNLALESEKIFEKDYIHVKSVKKDRLFEAQRLTNNLELVLISLFHYMQNDITSSITESGEKYSAIVQCMEKNIEKNISIEELAELCGMSCSGLKKTFKKYAGIGAGQYFNNMKMIRAAESIKEGKSVSEAALEVGFTDPNYFSTAFKRICGYSPSQLKKNI